MACRLAGAKPLSEPMLEYCQLGPYKQNSVKFLSKFRHFHSRKCIWKCRLRNGSHFVSASMCLDSKVLKCINQKRDVYEGIHLTPASSMAVDALDWCWFRFERKLPASTWFWPRFCTVVAYVDGLVLQRRNSIANALELRLCCTNPSMYWVHTTDFIVWSLRRNEEWASHSMLSFWMKTVPGVRGFVNLGLQLIYLRFSCNKANIVSCI